MAGIRVRGIRASIPVGKVIGRPVGPRGKSGAVQLMDISSLGQGGLGGASAGAGGNPGGGGVPFTLNSGTNFGISTPGLVAPGTTVTIGATTDNLKFTNLTLLGLFRLLQTTDTSWSVFGTPQVVVATHGATLNTILGYTFNDSPANTTGFPAGINGYGKVASGGTNNQAFGVFGFAEAGDVQCGAFAAEFTASNISGVTPVVALPPNIGTNHPAVNGLNVTAHSNGGNDCSVGINITADLQDFTKAVFNTGIYINMFRQYGIFIDAMPSGSQTSAIINNNGGGTNLQLQTTGSITPAAVVIGMYDSGASLRFYITQDGTIVYGKGANATTATGPFLYLGSCAGTPTGIPARAAAGQEAIIYDTTAHKLWVYDHGTATWKGVGLV